MEFCQVNFLNKNTKVDKSIIVSLFSFPFVEQVPAPQMMVLYDLCGPRFLR
jgi:hypothetical protein